MDVKGDWWNYSWNLAPGCDKVGPECVHCWALTMAKRLQGMKKPGYEGLVSPNGQWSGRVNLLEDRLERVYRLRRPRTIAVNLMGDLFHPRVPDEFIEHVFRTMTAAWWHTYLVLTKRPERAVEFFKSSNRGPLRNVWFGTTAGTQRSANQRWSAMSWIAGQGWITWVSSEPRLEEIDWHGWEFLRRLVVGGESGPGARPMAPAWAEADASWCQAHEVEFWFKQWGNGQENSNELPG